MTIGRLITAAAAGALLAAGFPPIHWPAVLPLGIAALVLALRDTQPRQGAYLGLTAGLIFYAITLPWLFNLFGKAAVTLICIAAAFPMFFAAAFTLVRMRLPKVPSWVVAAVLWTGIEYFRSELFLLRFTWMGLGYAPINYVFFGAAASLFGSYGISFFIVAVGSIMAESPLPRAAHRVFVLAVAMIWLSPFAAQTVFPISQLQPNNPMSVRLVQARAGEVTEAIRLSRSRNPVPVDVILWPEYILTEDPTQNAEDWAAISAVPKDTGAHLIFGGKEAIEPDAAAYHNTAFVLNPLGAVIGKHFKNHPVHFLKDGTPGTNASPIDTGLGKLGVAICFDLDYPDVARRLTQRGAEVLLVPNMDPEEWGDLQRVQHRIMFQMRAAECGRWLARADVAGGTSVVAPNGQEVERIHTSEPRAMEVIIGREYVQTAYTRGGWIMGPLCLASGIVLFVFSLKRKPVILDTAD